jgi:glycosyltransferase involved in cell wall biosynthesis
MNASVVIPTRDRAVLVELAIESALAAQDVAEIIVVNDGSTDDTPDRLRRFGSRIEIVEGSFGSPSAARNAGARRVNSPFIAFLDSDDEMLPGKIPCLASAFEDPRVGLAHGRVQSMEERGGPTSQVPEGGSPPRRPIVSYADLARGWSILSSSTLIRKRAFDDVNGYDESLIDPYEDLDLYLRLALRWDVVHREYPVARYRTWPGNFSYESHVRGMEAMVAKHLRLLDEGLRVAEPERARYGLLRRLVVNSHTMLREREARRRTLATWRAHPPSALRDAGLVRIFVASFLPRRMLRGRRPHLVDGDVR